MCALTAVGALLDPRLPVIGSDATAEEIWNLVIERDGVEMALPTPPQS